MKEELLEYLGCPECRNSLKLKNAVKQNYEIKEGQLYCLCGANFKIKNYIPRFVNNDYYSSSFSFEWRLHRKTQLDSANKGSRMEGISERDFSDRVDFPLSALKGKLVLDAGCGMGRFAEVAAKYGAEVICMDLSQSVDIALDNIGFKDNVNIIQADIFKLPFKENIFDFIYSFGVLHHTPDCEKAFRGLVKFLKKGGKISIFVYSSYNKGVIYMSNFWRFFTTRLPKNILYLLSYISIPLYYIYKIPVIGSIGKMLFVIPMWPKWRWRVLDTFDWYSPKYQSKHNHWEVFRWFSEEGLKDVKIFPGEVTLSGQKQ